MDNPRERVETVAGCRVHMLRGGDGPPLLFLHGARGVSGWWPFLRALSERFDVIVPDHPGFGRSETPVWLDTIADLGFFYLDFMAALGLTGVHVVGTSLGGWVAAELAVRDTARVGTLNLIAPAGIQVPGVPMGDIFLWSPEEAVRNQYADQRMADVLLSLTPGEDEQQRQVRNSLMFAKLCWQPRLHDPHLGKWLHRINRPTQLIWGDGDKVIPPAYGAVYRDLIPGARLEIVARCGHLPHIEQADEVVALVTGFCARAASSGG